MLLEKELYRQANNAYSMQSPFQIGFRESSILMKKTQTSQSLPSYVITLIIHILRIAFKSFTTQC